jgi:hypothetical protein
MYRRPSKVVQNHICNVIDQMVFVRQARENDDFSGIYIEKE